MKFAQTNRTVGDGLRRWEEKRKNRKSYNRIAELHKIKMGTLEAGNHRHCKKRQHSMEEHDHFPE